MKPLFLFIALLSAFFSFQQPPRLKGAYKLEYDNKYQLQTCKLTFGDSTYVKKLPDGLTGKGKIVYGKYKVTLEPDNNDNPIVIDLRELANDTVKFATKSKTDRSMTINRGNMIRLK